MSHLLLLLLAAPVTYELDPKKTELLALTSPGGFPGAAHPHVIVATRVTGSVVYDAEEPAASTVNVSFPTDGLEADRPALRKREGLGDLSDGSREGINNNMRGDDQLNPRLFPAISFTSTAVKDLGHGLLEVSGKLSIRNVEKEIALPVTVKVKDGELVGQGAVVIKHTDFKFKPYSAVLGAVKNLDEIALKVKLVGRAKDEPKTVGSQP
jgi:polyisoprenoid-binding protein YceI